ncbi:ABC transporter substrate-binding protein [Desulfovibrio aerotolerans]|uniref:ABC transporter substrate-binding protein n=1 Tax=Solidesulfovibrio aerotolerans TaxID=295255 RepID=A0A7C9MDH7_9BACT|nr:iron ABC transporter substrate-binding protein [Solidesulfovibrio aerotolerans]MYL81850.1 ABC transporter substrate-binding protein [Solidesulfovibrio aerotolerans]
MGFIHRHWLVLAATLCLAVLPGHGDARTITDALGREHSLADQISNVICSGPGCLRLLVYLQAQDAVVGVDDIEGKRRQFDARPYALAQPQLQVLPVFGEFRGFDHPEQILALSPQPQVIFKVHSPGQGMDPLELQEKTGIPVVVLDYGDLGGKRPRLYASLRLLGDVLGKRDRAEAVVDFFETRIAALERRTADLPEAARSGVYVGGVASRGAQGLQSTEPNYPPFAFVHARNLAAGGAAGAVVVVAKEQIVAWNPDVLFLDLATLQLGEAGGGLYELKTDPAYQSLSAVAKGHVYSVLPYNWYSTNYGSLLANAAFIGKTLYPDRFADVDPVVEADTIYTFLVGRPVFGEMNARFGNLAFAPVICQ